MDVHKESIEIAIAEGANTEVRRYGKIGGTQDAMRKTLRKLVSPGKSLHFCYEAGPCGYELYRYLVSEGHDCWVVAPSMIPKRPGDKVKTDKRDAVQLARLFRAGEPPPSMYRIVKMRPSVIYHVPEKILCWYASQHVSA